jgi:putative transposase
MSNPRIFRYFKTSPEIIRLAVMMYIRYPLSLRNVEELLHERGIDITHEPCGSGETGSGRFSRPRSDGTAFRRCAHSGIASGISKKGTGDASLPADA